MSRSSYQSCTGCCEIRLLNRPIDTWQRLAVCFNIVLPPHGRGKAMVVLSEPDKDAGESAGNICITDNSIMMTYLRTEFLAKFPTFRGAPDLER